jgi:hypothetical protein
MFTLRCRQADFVASDSSPLSLTPAIKYHHGVVVTGDKLSPVLLLPVVAGNNETGDKTHTQ